ncbi:OLC1v1034011C2 [Oldenlandia corymbosa var. corymbosa]|uniref:OLC1v1034011C2 n=1 Tax=Oldenlandia corymbosa var. corymbosa TaxID=529605 RepID=A0AAV1CQX7_OLDCO|nr:OLC1v1034011C2 [Oldenlandia corymbosa var. corymbosa]
MNPSVIRSANKLRQLKHIGNRPNSSPVRTIANVSPSFVNRRSDHYTHLSPRHSRCLSALSYSKHFRSGDARREIWKEMVDYSVVWPSRYVHAPINLGIHVVPDDKAYVVERLGRYLKTLWGGTHLLIPLVDRISFVHGLRNQCVPLYPLVATTKDKRRVTLDSFLSYRIFNPKLASYEAKNPLSYMVLRAVDVMRSEIFKINLKDLGVKLFDITEKAKELQMVMKSLEFEGVAPDIKEDLITVQNFAKALKSPEFAENPVARDLRKLGETIITVAKMAIKAAKRKDGASSEVSKEKGEGAMVGAIGSIKKEEAVKK